MRLIALVALLVLPSLSEAGLRDRLRIRSSPAAVVVASKPVAAPRPVENFPRPMPGPSVVTATATVTASASVGDGLAEVNAKRAARGLRPFVRDDGLTAAAMACAGFRAQHRLFGHTSNDFSFLRGARASSAGCAAYPASYGWMSCCTYENYTYAGAAWVTGADGKRYMHLFVR